jgi:hypothetical protein
MEDQLRESRRRSTQAKAIALIWHCREVNMKTYLNSIQMCTSAVFKTIGLDRQGPEA